MSDTKTLTALEKLPETISYRGKVYELFIQKTKIAGRVVWDVTYATDKYFCSGKGVPENALLYGFTGSPDLEDTAASCLIRLGQKGLYTDA